MPWLNLILSFLLVIASLPSAWADTITLSADIWCPYNCEPNATLPGIMVEIAQATLEPHGHTVIYQVRPWKRAIHDAEQGKISGIIGATRTDAPNLVFPPCDMVDYLATFYVRKGSPWRYTGLPSLAEKKLGIIAGYSYGPEIDTYVQSKSGRVYESDGDAGCAMNIRHLETGRLDVILEDRNVIDYLRGQNEFIQELEQAGTLPPRDMNIAFSPKLARASDYADLLCQGLKELRTSGRLKTMMNKYGMNAQPTTE